jgi:hypothetical protein
MDDSAVTDRDDFTQLDDSALLSWRAETRVELERLPPASPGRAALTARYDESTAEVDARARAAWAKAVRALTPPATSATTKEHTSEHTSE